MHRFSYATIVLVLAALCGGAAQAQFGGGPKAAVDAVAESAVPAGGTVRVAVSVQLDAGWHVNANKPLDDFLIPTELSFAEDPRWRVQRVVYPAHKLFRFEFSPEPLAVYEEKFALGAAIEIPAETPPGPLELSGSLRYQACNDKQCAPPKSVPVAVALEVVPAGTAVTPAHAERFAAIVWDSSAPAGEAAPKPEAEAAAPKPETKAEGGDWRAQLERYAVAGRLAGYADAASFLAFLDAAESGKAASENYLAGLGFLAMILAVLGGGLLLNLTPCVLPLMPINIAIIGAGARAGSKSRGFLLGGVYGLAMAVVYGVLGLVVVFGFSTFGTINAFWQFNAAMAALFAVLSLAMFDAVQIDFSRFQAAVGLRRNERGSVLVAFAMGAISALLAGACVAPVVIAVILHAQTLYAEGNAAALLLPFLLGLGMALPWPLLGAGLSFLPKPGKWMNRVKYAIGAAILVLAAWYGREAWHQFQSGRIAAEAGGAADTQGWETDLDAALAKGLAEGKPVFIDFWATWCKNCLVMDQTTFKDAQVLERLGGYVKLKYQAEDPAAAPAKDVLEHFEVLGLPSYVVLEPKG